MRFRGAIGVGLAAMFGCSGEPVLAKGDVVHLVRKVGINQMTRYKLRTEVTHLRSGDDSQGPWIEGVLTETVLLAESGGFRGTLKLTDVKSNNPGERGRGPTSFYADITGHSREPDTFPLWVPLPSKQLKVGDSWKSAIPAVQGGLEIEFKIVRVESGPKGRVAVLTMAAAEDSTRDNGFEPSGSQVAVTGELRLDLLDGRLVSGEWSHKHVFVGPARPQGTLTRYRYTRI